MFSESLNKMMVWGIAIPRIEMRRGDWKVPTLNVAKGATFKGGAPGKIMDWGIAIPRIEMWRGDWENPHPKRRKERDV
jgi:hypothetical protein